MGFYINETKDGKHLPSKGKAQFLIEHAGATEVQQPVEFQENLVCVVENVMFDAAGYAYSEEEFEVFKTSGADRPRKWLIVPHAAELSGFKKPDKVN